MNLLPGTQLFEPFGAAFQDSFQEEVWIGSWNQELNTGTHMWDASTLLVIFLH